MVSLKRLIFEPGIKYKESTVEVENSVSSRKKGPLGETLDFFVYIK